VQPIQPAKQNGVGSQTIAAVSPILTTSKTQSTDEQSSTTIKALPKVSAPIVITTTVPAVQSVQKNQLPVYKNREEAVKAFKELLSDAGVNVTWDWPTAMKKIVNDKRYKALNKVQEKQAVFHEYVEEKKKQEREEVAERKKTQRENFVALLSEVSDLTSRSHYRQVVSRIQHDPRYLAVESEEDRLDYYDSFMDELVQKEKELRRVKQSEYKSQLKELLLKRADLGEITSKSSSRIMDQLFPDEESYRGLNSAIRIEVWDEVLNILARKEDEQRAIDRENRKKKEKELRAQFREVLVKLHQEQKINVLSRWKEIKPLIQDDESYKKVTTRAQDIFEDYLDELEGIYASNKKTMRQILKDLNYAITVNTSFEEFYTAVSSDDRFKTLDPGNVKILFEDSQDKAKQRERRRKKHSGRFLQLLKDIGVVRVDSIWVQVKPLIQDKRAFAKVKTEEDRISLFNEYVQSLTAPLQPQQQLLQQPQQEQVTEPTATTSEVTSGNKREREDDSTADQPDTKKQKTDSEVPDLN
jgi:pre-mRNA-processing factor 40